MLSKSKSKCYFNGAEITEEKYNEILEIIKNKPVPPEGYDYKLNDALEWEAYEVVNEEVTEEVDPETALNELLEVIGSDSE